MIDVKIESLSHDGRGLTHIEGKTVFVENALPDETVQIEITKKHSRFNEARAIEIIKASPHRTTPICQHFSLCGGCDLQHFKTDQQLQHKQNTLLEQFQHFGNIQPDEILPPITGPDQGYRYKARLAVKYVRKKEKVLIGFHEKNGRFVADLSGCEVLHPSIGKLFEELRALISNLSIYNKLAQIEFAHDDTNAALIFRHIVDLPDTDRDQILAFAKEHHIHIYLHPNKPHKISKLWPEDDNDLLKYQLGDINFSFHPTDFTQINPAINRKMVAQAIELLAITPTDHVLDLFCGLGNFTLPIATKCADVTGIEADQKMVERARMNALQNQIHNAHFEATNLFEENLLHSWMKKPYNKILLDPPRTGAIEIIESFPKWQPERIVYVSCNPATLARDAGILVNQQGYQLVKAGVMDMFPHTKHVESMALFVKN